MAEENAVLMYKGRPLMRKDNLIYYGSMADSHIVMLQILETKQVNGQEVASRVSVQLQLTDPAARSRTGSLKRAKKMASTLLWILAVYGWKELWQANKFLVRKTEVLYESQK